MDKLLADGRCGRCYNPSTVPSQSCILGPWVFWLIVPAAIAFGLLLGRRFARPRHQRELDAVRRESHEETRAELERSRAEQAQLESRIRKLQEQRRRGDDILRHLRQGVVVLDRELVVEWTNPAARRLTRRTSVQLVGIPFDSLEWRNGQRGTGFDASHPGPWRECLWSGTPVDPVRLSLSLDGEILWFEVFCFPTTDPEGKAEQVVVLLEDVTRHAASHPKADPSHLPTTPSPVSSGFPPLPSDAPGTSCVGLDGRKANGQEVLRVLLVEDNPVNQAVAMGILRKLGLELEMAADGQQALERLSKTGFRLVFMDCQMPVMDGYEATRRIRDPSSPVLDHAIPIVAVTANALKGDREKCLECGMDDYLPKPVTRDGFERILMRWIPGWAPVAISAFPLAPEEPPSQLSTPDQREVFDRPALLRRLLGQEELIGTLLSMFDQDVPLQLAKLQEVVDQGNFAEGQRIAHGLKGTMANLEARTAAQAASVVDHACRKGDLQVLGDALADLREEIRRAQEAMRASR